MGGRLEDEGRVLGGFTPCRQGRCAAHRPCPSPEQRRPLPAHLIHSPSAVKVPSSALAPSTSTTPSALMVQCWPRSARSAGTTTRSKGDTTSIREEAGGERAGRGRGGMEVRRGRCVCTELQPECERVQSQGGG